MMPDIRPRWLTEAEAAAYVRMTVEDFRKAVAMGLAPQPRALKDTFKEKQFYLHARRKIFGGNKIKLQS